MSSINQLVSPAEAKDIGEKLGVNFRRFSVEEYRSLMEGVASTSPNSDEEWLRLGKIAASQLKKQSPDLQLQSMHLYSGIGSCEGREIMKVLQSLFILAITWFVITRLLGFSINFS